MTNYTLIGVDQKQYGPVTDEQLRQWIRDGRVNQQSQVKVNGDAEWRPVSAFPELAKMFGGGTASSTASSEPAPQATRLKTRLKLLLSMEALCIICVVVMSIFSDYLLPEQLRDYETSVAAAPTMLIGWIGGAVFVILLPTALTATIGLFLGWRPARALYLWTRITVVAIGPLQGINVEPGCAALFDDAAVLVAGVIIGMLYYSQLNELYSKPKSAT